MAELDGVKEIFLKSAPPDGITPSVGFIYKWVEIDGANVLYKYMLSN